MPTVASSRAHATRLGLAWVVVVAVLAAMVAVPFVLYLRGRAVRNELTFDVARLELAIERASGAMTNRERAFRAYLYEPDPPHLAAFDATAAPLESALEEVEAQARSSDPRSGELAELAASWDEIARDLVERTRRGEHPRLDDSGAPRPGPVFERFRAAAAERLDELAARRVELVASLEALDDARLALSLVFGVLAIPVLGYVGSLSRRVLSLLAAARADHERLASILEQMADSVVVIDVDARATLLNPAARALTGLREGDDVRSLGPRLRTGESGDPRALLDRVAGGATIDAEATIAAPSGADVPIGLVSAPVSIAGTRSGAVIVARDLTERARFERERVEAERARALAAIAERVAHDFGNYLEAAGAATAMLDRPTASDPSQRAPWISLIRGILAEGKESLASLRAVGSAGRGPLRLSDVDLRTLLARAVEIARMARRDASSSIEVHRDVEPIAIRAAELDLQRAVVNLVINALDATPAGGRIDVIARRSGDRVRIEVRDSGAGIAPENVDRIFDLYFTTKGDRGSGLGLTVAREVVRRHGGELRASSEPGRGASFVADLPLRPDAAAAAPEQIEARVAM
jgi:PAS domain S-box-containing protein